MDSRVPREETKDEAKKDRPPCPGDRRLYDWSEKKQHWSKKSPAKLKAKQERYRLHVGAKVMADHQLFMMMRLRMYPDFDLTRDDVEARNEKWFYWVEYHNAAEVAFTALAAPLYQRQAEREHVESVIVQNIISNVAELDSTYTDVEIEIPSNVRPTEKIEYKVEEIIEKKSEERRRVAKITIFSEEQEKMKRELRKQDFSEVRLCTAMFLGAETYGVYQPLSQPQTVKSRVSKCSKFCEVPSLVNDIIAERDAEYKHLLQIQALGLPCSCLSAFRPSDPRPSRHVLTKCKRVFKAVYSCNPVFKESRKRILDSYNYAKNPYFWMRSLMILRGLVKQGTCDQHLDSYLGLPEGGGIKDGEMPRGCIPSPT